MGFGAQTKTRVMPQWYIMFVKIVTIPTGGLVRVSLWSSATWLESICDEHHFHWGLVSGSHVVQRLALCPLPLQLRRRPGLHNKLRLLSEENNISLLLAMFRLATR